eukprot:gene9159-biopygen22692
MARRGRVALRPPREHIAVATVGEVVILDGPQAGRLSDMHRASVSFSLGEEFCKTGSRFSGPCQIDFSSHAAEIGSSFFWSRASGFRANAHE